MLLVVTVSATVMAPGGLRFVLPALVLATALAAWERAWQRVIGLPVIAVALFTLGWLVPVWWPNPFTAVISLTAAYAIRFLAAIGIGMHVIATTSPTRMSAALRSWRTPRPISVTLAVMLRFFPVVAMETSGVLDGMRLRGLAGVWGVTRHPVLSIERFTVPMIAASLRAGEDLSASAILRGLGSRRRPTTMTPPHFGAADVLLVVLIAALAIAAFLFTSPLT
jgi:energy-coupling factor transport system permease protein